jgi:hypothetical protein
MYSVNKKKPGRRDGSRAGWSRNIYNQARGVAVAIINGGKPRSVVGDPERTGGYDAPRIDQARICTNSFAAADTLPRTRTLPFLS